MPWLFFFVVVTCCLTGCEKDSEKMNACKQSCGEPGMAFFVANGQQPICICQLKGSGK